MIIVIQCAATKRQGAGCLVSAGGRKVIFVAKPEAAPAHSACLYVRPDDPSGDGRSWRETLLEYNQMPGNNPLNLYPAFRLYENPTYARLVDAFGEANVYILSAGWGLVTASFLIPYYDITFSSSTPEYKRRRKADRYRDFCMLPADDKTEIVFLGGKDYVPLFSSLTSHMRNARTIFYNSALAPDAPGCTLKRFSTSTRTNWHYECANSSVGGGHHLVGAAMQIVLNPNATKGTELRDLYNRALDEAEELYIASAYLTDWDTSYKLGSACRRVVFLVGTDFGLTRKAAMLNVLRWVPNIFRSRSWLSNR